jgi:hypothetical protein
MNKRKKIEALTRVYLLRPARRSKRFIDMDAVEAVVKAATECGIPRVWGWAKPDLSVKGLVSAYFSRVVESYGTLEF